MALEAAEKWNRVLNVPEQTSLQHNALRDFNASGQNSTSGHMSWGKDRILNTSFLATLFLSRVPPHKNSLGFAIPVYFFSFSEAPPHRLHSSWDLAPVELSSSSCTLAEMTSESEQIRVQQAARRRENTTCLICTAPCSEQPGAALGNQQPLSPADLSKLPRGAGLGARMAGIDRDEVPRGTSADSSVLVAFHVN